MFTGIIEETGEIKSFQGQTVLEVLCSKVLDDIKLGDSIAINGVCQTVVEFGSNFFKVEVSPETLAVTNFSKLSAGTKVNLERALTPTSRMGGHIVQGHVDQTATFLKAEKLDNFYNLYFETDDTKYIVKKGSITVNGISLTVADVNETCFKIAVIPHTFENTTLNALQIGATVNIETDILGRYIEKILSAQNNKSKISMEFLRENGFV
ncbi:MAG: riboflavin synthase [Fusobacterium sp.]|nr:riboflavin synthase [Fusobacterium sp.]